jgi:hypothetical protein
MQDVRIEIMKDEDKFSGKSRLNILAAGLFLAAFCVPVFIIASVDRSAFPEFNGDKVVAAAWVLTCLVLSAVCAMGARTRERLARLESLVGLRDNGESEQMHPEVQSEGAPSD